MLPTLPNTAVLSRKSIQVARAFIRFWSSRRALPVYKGSLAYLLGYVLVFSRKFDDLNQFPATFTSMTILLIVGGPGKSVGACIQSVALALFGVALGSVCFVVLAKLVHAPVAQGFVFAAFVYLFALVKAKGLKWFPLALIGILMAFNGIYTSILVGRFEKSYLEEYIKVYCWAGAIVLAVNLLVFPVTSEKELRRTLILSLEHIATLTHLLAKGYTLELTEDEREVRAQLAQSIRADFGFLIQKIEETSIEINISRFSMADYQNFVARTRGMQLALITVYSSLVNFEQKDQELFKTKFLPNTIHSFNSLRAALSTTMQEIRSELGCTAAVIPSTQPGYVDYMDVERQDTRETLSLSRRNTDNAVRDSIDERLDLVSRRLAEEFGEGDMVDDPTQEPSSPGNVNHLDATVRPSDDRSPHSLQPDTHPHAHTAESTTANTNVASTKEPFTAAPPTNAACPQHKGRCIRSLRRVFDTFAADQHDILTDALISGKLHGSDDSLRLADPLPSLRDTYQYRYVPSAALDSEKATVRTRRRRRRTWMDDVVGVESGYATPSPSRDGQTEPEKDEFYEILRERTFEEQKSDETTTASHHSLTRVYSFVFAMDQFVHELEQLYYACKGVQKRRVHVHFFEALHRPDGSKLAVPSLSVSHNPQPQGIDPQVHEDARELSVSEALALLEHRTYTHPKPNFWQRLEQMEQWIRSPASLFAAKTAAAATVFAVLILHPVPRPWFISFGMTGGALTIVTALTPTLGQSILGFLFQILGSGFGYVWALTILEMFKNVGGYHFNPYGLVALLAPYSLVFVYILYEKPQFFVAALLALNGTGTVLIIEWVNVEYLGNTNFDSPGLRFAKAFTTLGVALGIAGTFQLFILRNPARKTLRKRIGSMLFAQLSYVTMLQAYARGSMPTDPSSRPPDAALLRVEQELRHRELKIQAELISLRPLVGFSAAEPQFTRPFRADVINHLLRTSQIILDRMRESRTAIGIQPLPNIILKNFTQILSPYRRRNTQILQLSFFLIASSMMAKSPLPRETPAELETAGQMANFMHDILVLAGRHAKTEEGARTIRSGSFTRYFHYLVCITSLMEHIKTIEDACKDLFGELEDSLA